MMRGMITTSIALLLAGTAQAAGPFTLSSTSFRDGQPLAVKHAGDNPTSPNCVGANVSPQLSWSNLPEGTRSVAVLMIDPEGRNGLGVNHWVAYGFPVAKTSLVEGEATRAPDGYVGGKSTQGLDHYMGPCTPPHTSWHHYSWLAIATDLAPDALPAGLTKDELFAKLQGHAKASAGLIGLFKHQ